MKHSLRLMRIAGIDIGLHYSWIFIFILITASLAAGLFPQMYPEWEQATYWITGILAALLLFVSVLIHELAHSLVAKARGMSVTGITLFLLGGVSNLEEEPEEPKVEFSMAIVGPLASLILAGVFWGLLQLVEDRQSPLAATIGYLALINGVLAVFNLLPGYPLDGGRVLRSILWSRTGSLIRATNIAATVGQVLGWALIAFGLLQVLAGNLGGLWLALIGWFLSSSAEASRQQLTMREQLKGVRVTEAVRTRPESIGPDTNIVELVNEVFRREQRRAVPVCSDDRVLGIVTITDVREVPQEKWSQTPVREIMTREPLYSVSSKDDLNTAMTLITKHDINQVLVVDNNRCTGVVNRADILNYLQLSHELSFRRPGR